MKQPPKGDQLVMTELGLKVIFICRTGPPSMTPLDEALTSDIKGKQREHVKYTHASQGAKSSILKIEMTFYKFNHTSSRGETVIRNTHYLSSDGPVRSREIQRGTKQELSSETTCSTVL